MQMHTTAVTARQRGPVRHLALLAALALVGSAAVVGTAVGADEGPAGSNISIVQTDTPTQGPCLPRWLALSYTVADTATSFTLNVTASAPLCDPVWDASAVIYAMPGDSIAWPQELRERVAFTISKAGTTAITFTKTCLPVQFDVVTGATPQTIAPWGEWHGPLLFPLDINTALQHWGYPCEVTTTTASTTTTTEPTTTTQSTTSTTSTTTTASTTTTTAPTTTTTTTTPTTSTTTTIPTSVSGCTPGYWKQSQHRGSWVGYAATSKYDQVFGITSGLGSKLTLLDALGIGGGGAKALARHATAALLNASNPAVGSGFTTQQVIGLVQWAYEAGDFDTAKNLFEKANETGCGLGRNPG